MNFKQKAIGMLTLTAAFASAQAPPELKAGLYAVFDTSEGVITARLYDRYTPIAVTNFVGLANGTRPWWDPKVKAWVKRPLYNGITFHRVLRDQMIQSGDPTGKGNHNCGFTIRDEYLPGLTFDHPGRLGVANTGSADSGACQFFITDGSMAEWNQHYTVFGEVVSGLDVVHRISRMPTVHEKPVTPVLLKKVTIVRRVAPASEVKPSSK